MTNTNNNTTKDRDGLAKELDQLKNQLSEMENNWKRALADYTNLQKRISEEKETYIRYANESMLLELLPVIDNFELLGQHTEDQGFELTLKDLRRVLKNIGLQEIEALDKDFDESLMEAVELVEGKKGKVVEIIKKGYLLNGKVLRPSYVKVGKGENKHE